jgi:hypothetical protein
LETIQEEANFDNVQAEKELKEEIHVLMEQEELKWRPWAKQDWLRDGDHNTKFFHAVQTSTNIETEFMKLLIGRVAFVQPRPQLSKLLLTTIGYTLRR